MGQVQGVQPPVVPSIPHGEAGVRQVGHRAYVGGLWDEMGRLQFDFLARRGLRPAHYPLDVGCGSLRGGVHFIAYLEEGHYLGLEKEPALLEGGVQELGEELFLRKRPRACTCRRRSTPGRSASRRTARGAVGVHPPAGSDCVRLPPPTAALRAAGRGLFRHVLRVVPAPRQPPPGPRPRLFCLYQRRNGFIGPAGGLGRGVRRGMGPPARAADDEFSAALTVRRGRPHWGRVSPTKAAKHDGPRKAGPRSHTSSL